MILSTTRLYPAVVPDELLQNGWHENVSNRTSESLFLNLDQTISYCYVNGNETFPASLRVTTSKSIVLPPEQELLTRGETQIFSTLEKQNHQVNKTLMKQGNRFLSNNHQTTYKIYNVTETDENTTYQHSLIIEVWNCGVSKTSIICCGMAKQTHSSESNQHYRIFWKSIISDPMGTFGSFYQSNAGFIYNIICH